MAPTGEVMRIPRTAMVRIYHKHTEMYNVLLQLYINSLGKGLVKSAFEPKRPIRPDRITGSVALID